ncbi:unnamed protein product, partial [Allacma fusca]
MGGCCNILFGLLDRVDDMMIFIT